MKSIVFDSGPLINLALNNLLWILPPLKQRFKGEFYITNSVKRECMDRPLTSKKFKFEALQMLKLLEQGTIKTYDHPQLKDKTYELLKQANNLFTVHNNYIKNVQYAEVESIVASQILKSSAVVIDEFITRTLLETPLSVKKRMEKKLHNNVNVDKKNLIIFQKLVKDVKVIRSLELVIIAYEIGMFKEYYLKINNPKQTLLDGLLWAIKLNGCSVTEKEIQEIQKIELN